MGGEDGTGKKRTKYHRPPAGLAAMLAAGQPFRTVAKATGVDEETIARWLRTKPELREEVDRIQRERSDQVTRELRGYDSLGVLVLHGVLSGEHCEECGRGPAEPRDRLKALDMLWSRIGRPAVSGVQHSGSVEVAPPTGAQADRVIVSSAAEVLREWGYPDLASQVDDAVAAGPQVEE